MEKLSKENTPCNGDETIDQNNNADNYKSKEVGEKVSKVEQTKISAREKCYLTQISNEPPSIKLC